MHWSCTHTRSHSLKHHTSSRHSTPTCGKRACRAYEIPYLHDCKSTNETSWMLRQSYNFHVCAAVLASTISLFRARVRKAFSILKNHYCLFGAHGSIVSWWKGRHRSRIASRITLTRLVLLPATFHQFLLRCSVNHYECSKCGKHSALVHDNIHRCCYSLCSRN